MAKVLISIRLDSELIQRIKHLSNLEGKTTSDLIREKLMEGLYNNIFI